MPVTLQAAAITLLLVFLGCVALILFSCAVVAGRADDQMEEIQRLHEKEGED